MTVCNASGIGPPTGTQPTRPNQDGRAVLVEVGLRDGFQAIGPLVPTDVKIDLLQRLYHTGLRRIEATAFVSEKALPQMADAASMLAAALELPDLDVQVLTPNRRYAERALEAGADHIAFVLSVSEAHNVNNVRLTPAQSAKEYLQLVQTLPSRIKVRLNVATAFDCPFDGAVDPQATLALIAPLVEAGPEVEVALCDTTGRVTPDRVAALFAAAAAKLPGVASWVFHGHDTYGLGVANVLAAYASGVCVFDAAFAGLGGCPFAPGATGNVATEDVVWTLDRMGVSTGVDLQALLPIAQQGAALPGALPGGRVRAALSGAGCVAGRLAA